MLRIHPEARREFRQAVAYYGKISRELAKRFIADVDHAFIKIMVAPNRYPVHIGEARVKQLKDFPYSVIYVVDREAPFIIAIMHQKRRPGYWLHRV